MSTAPWWYTLATDLPGFPAKQGWRAGGWPTVPGRPFAVSELQGVSVVQSSLGAGRNPCLY